MMSDLNINLQVLNGEQAPGDDNADVPDLIRTLQNAYRNAVKRDTANPDSEATDLLLENASIRLSSRILSAITTDACTSNDSETTGSDDACSLDHESLDHQSIDLRSLTNVLSYAASQLQRIGASAGASNGIETMETARLRSLEHVYRMTFAFSKAYLDRSQGHAYLEAAHQQLELARQHIQDEKDLCTCGSKGYGDDLLELFELSDHLDIARTQGETR
jgi:hypothetical protein